MTAARFFRPRPTAAAVIGIGIMELVAVLPQQIAWADSVGRPDSGLLTELRWYTVSPTMLYGPHSGLAALRYEFVWVSVFIGVLVAAATFVTRRLSAPEPALAVRWQALILLSGPANLIALCVANFPTLAFRAQERTETLGRILADTGDSAGHTAALALGGCLTLLLTPGALDDGLPKKAPPSARLAAQLRELGGPLQTVWRRAGAALVTALCAPTAFLGISGTYSQEVTARLVKALCATGPQSPTCTVDSEAFHDAVLPELGVPLGTPLEERLTQLCAWNFSCLSFFLAYFLWRAVTQAVPSRRAAVFFAAWNAYAVASLTYHAIKDQVYLLKVDLMGFGRDINAVHNAVEVLLPPSGLLHAQFVGPLIAGVLALLAGVLADRRPGRIRSAEDQAANVEDDGSEATVQAAGTAGG